MEDKFLICAYELSYGVPNFRLISKEFIYRKLNISKLEGEVILNSLISSGFLKDGAKLTFLITEMGISKVESIDGFIPQFDK